MVVRQRVTRGEAQHPLDAVYLGAFRSRRPNRAMAVGSQGDQYRYDRHRNNHSHTYHGGRGASRLAVFTVCVSADSEGLLADGRVPRCRFLFHLERCPNRQVGNLLAGP
jgi:hypothetical protein